MVKRKSVLASHKRQEKREKSAKILIGIVFMLLMVMSVFGVLLYSPSAASDVVQDFGYSFELITVDGSQVWQTKIDNQEVQFVRLPSQLEYIETNFNKLYLESTQLYIAFDPNEKDLEIIDVARLLLAKDMQKNNQNAISAITNESALYASFPVISCSDVSLPTVLFRYGNETKIVEEESCIIIEAISPQQMIDAVEKLRFTYYDINNVEG